LVFAGEVTIFPGKATASKQVGFFKIEGIILFILPGILPMKFHPEKTSPRHFPIKFHPTSHLPGHWYCVSAARRFPIGISRSNPTEIVGEDTPQVNNDGPRSVAGC
jgi:hypothetical protein